MIGESDIVVSLLPASMHPDVADACIDAATDLVTASYESEAMRNLNER
jgi:saccharopine dehydrogenase-like NADP-dependent oxidoreductase